MAQVKTGDTVKIHYTGKLDDGTVFDSSVEREPLEFKVGEGQVIPGFESAVIDMTVGDEKQFTIPPDDAYGSKREDMVLEVPKADLPDEITPEVGLPLQIQAQDGSVADVVVSDIKDETITIDGNHPLAGENLNFEVKLVEIL